MNRTLFSVAAAAAMACALLSACSKEEKKQDTTADDIPTVKVQQVSEQDVRQDFTYTATMEADKINNISSSMPLRIKSILVEEGQRVGKGQRLVVLDDVNTTTYSLQLANAEAELRNVELNYNRAVELFKIGGGTRQSVDQMELQLAASRNAVASARRALANAGENSVLTSPVSGVVTVRNYDPGDMTSSLPILTIAQVQPIKAVINVSESEYALVRTGMGADLLIDSYVDTPFHGVVTKILPTVDQATRTFGVEISLPNADSRILPGMFAKVTLTLGTARHTVVPDRAVVKQQGSGDHYVYIYHPDTGTVSYDKVELGRRLGDTYELISGVPAGAQVVVSGQAALTAGKKVNVQK